LRRAHIVGTSHPVATGKTLPHHTLADQSSPDYSIHYFAPLNLLIAHMRYIGKPGEFEQDMEAIKDDETTRRWWQVSSRNLPKFIQLSRPSVDRRDARELRRWRDRVRRWAGMVDVCRGGIQDGGMTLPQSASLGDPAAVSCCAFVSFPSGSPDISALLISWGLLTRYDIRSGKHTQVKVGL